MVPGCVAAAGGHHEKLFQLREGHRLEPGLELENPVGDLCALEEAARAPAQQGLDESEGLHVAKTVGQI